MTLTRTSLFWVFGLVSAVVSGCTQEFIATDSNPLPVNLVPPIWAEGNAGGGGGAGLGGQGGQAGQGGQGAGAGGGGVVFVSDCVAESGPPEIVKVGVGSKLLLVGCVVSPDKVFQGEVLVESDTLTCVGSSCAASPGAADATVVRTHGVIMPGMIDTHNHILFDLFDETDWAPTKAYGNHDQWTAEPRYGALVDAKQYLNGEGTPNLDPGFGCEMNKFGEMKGLVAGTTSIAGAANPSDKTCFGSLARTIDQKPNDLDSDKVQVSTLFPPSTGDTVCANIAADKTDAYIIHCGEGVDATALKEFAKLGTATTTPECLYAPETAIVHGTAFGENELQIMADRGMSLIWSPQSNVFLYGSGTDYTKTTNVKLAMELGINIALAPDWSLGGSQNLLDELRFAHKVDAAVFGDVFSAEQLVRMVTVNAAKALGLSSVLGSLEVGKKADITVIAGDVTKPFEAVLAATPRDVRLVVVNGVPLYGDSALAALGPASPGCEALDICGEQKFACVAEDGGTASNKLGQTWADITTTLETELATYDGLNLTEWKFAPIAPLVKCP